MNPALCRIKFKFEFVNFSWKTVKGVEVNEKVIQNNLRRWCPDDTTYFVFLSTLTTTTKLMNCHKKRFWYSHKANCEQASRIEKGGPSITCEQASRIEKGGPSITKFILISTRQALVEETLGFYSKSLKVT